MDIGCDRHIHQIDDRRATMIRKTLLALTAIAALGASVSAPTTADAKGFFKKKWHHHHGHRGWGKWGPAFGAAALIAGTAIAVESCYQRQWVETPYGMRKVRVYVC
jgi:hypothetical protein